MSSRNLVRLSTVEEDFKRIGILKEDEDEPTKVPLSKADASPGGDDVEHGKSSKKSKKGEEPCVDCEEPENHNEGWRTRVKSKIAQGEKVQTQHTVHEGWRTRVGKKLGMGKKHLNMGLETVSSLMEDVQSIVNRINVTERSEMVKGFAQMAIIAEAVANRFAIVAEADEDFTEAAENLHSLAEAAANLAEGLHSALAEGADFDASTEQIESEFKGMMSNMLEGLDVYSQLVEMAEAEDDDADDKDDKDGESDKDADDKDGDDKDDDDADDKKPAFLKGKKGEKPAFMKKGSGDEDDTDENFDSITQAAKNTNRPDYFNQDDKNPLAHGAQQGKYEAAK